MDNIRHIPSLQGLQALVEVADSGSFTQAAQTLCLTQSAVSRKIQQLESHFGVPMFVRTSRSLRLTPEGEQVLAEGPLQVISEEMGGPGTFDSPIDISTLPAGPPIRLALLDLSAADGSILAMDSVALVVK